MNIRWITSGILTSLVTLGVCWPASRVSPNGAVEGSRTAALLAAPIHPLPRQRPVLSSDDLQKYRPNEAGVVPILEYHDVASSEKWMSRSRSNFENDLDRLYEEGYRPISLAAYLSNRIDLPAGSSPVVLTFDDARASQFRYLPDGSLDPDCAVGILTQFHEDHPDFPLKATFFVLPKCAFEEPKTAVKKLKALVAWGFELGNHTVHHRMLHKLSDAQAEREIGGGAALLHQIAPEAKIETLAFPGGHPPNNSKLIAEGAYKGYHYTNRAGFMAYDAPAPSPVAKHQDRLHIKRIVACEDYGGITDWLNRIKNGEVKRYVSDGDPETTTIPHKFADRVDPARLNGATLRTY